MNPIIQLEHRGTDLGALLMCTAVFPGLKEQGYDIRFVCLKDGADLLEEHPLIDELIIANPGEFERATAQCKSPQRCLTFPRTNYREYFQTSLRNEPHTPRPPHRTESICKTADVPFSDALSVCINREMEDWGKRYSDCILVHSTTRASPYKNWPIDRWALLAKCITKETGIQVMQIGAKEDLPIAGVEKLNSPSIRHAIAALKCCKLFIGLDSLFNHASRAVRKPSIILWGSTHPQFHGYSQNLNLVNGLVWNENTDLKELALTCQPCYKHYQSKACTNTTQYFHQALPAYMHPNLELHRCMAIQSVDAVFEKALSMLATANT